MTKTCRVGFSRKRRRGGRKTLKRRGGRRRSRVIKRGGRRRSRVNRRRRAIGGLKPPWEYGSIDWGWFTRSSTANK